MLSEVWNSYLSSSDQTQQNGFRRTTSMCRERIREAMLHHRWEEAAEYMVYYPQILEDRNLFTAQPSKEVDFIRINKDLFKHSALNTAFMFILDLNALFEISVYLENCH